MSNYSNENEHREVEVLISEDENSSNRQNNHLKPQNGNTRTTSVDRRYNAQKNNELGDDRQKSHGVDAIGKNIRLLINGDPFFRGRVFVISTRRYRYFDAFMDDISDTLNANFGAVRKIFTIDGKNLSNLHDLIDGETYVASGNEKFIKLNYIEISAGKRQPPNRLPALSRDYQSFHINQYEGKNQSMVINVFKNGDILSPTNKILLYKNSMVSFEAVLNEISIKVQLMNGPILKLYTMAGETIFMPQQLENGSWYVAASREKFKNLEYAAGPESVRASFSKNASRDLPPVKITKDSVKKHTKTKVIFNKKNDESIFKGDSNVNDESSANFTDQSYDEQSYTNRNGYNHNGTYNNNNTNSNSYNEGAYTNRSIHDNDNNILDSEYEKNKAPEKSFREKEDEELKLSYQKLSDDDFSEINSTIENKNDN